MCGCITFRCSVCPPTMTLLTMTFLQNKKKEEEAWSCCSRLIFLLDLQELPLAVFRRPHCFCTWTSPLFGLTQQSDRQQCVENSTGSSAPTAPVQRDLFQVYHTPVLGETFGAFKAVKNHRGLSLYLSSVVTDHAQ